MTHDAAPDIDRQQWTRSAHVIEAESRRWATIRAVVVVVGLVVTALSWIAYGLGGTLIVAPLCVLGYAMFSLTRSGARTDAHASVTLTPQHLIIDGPLPATIERCEISGARVTQRTAVSETPTGEGVRSKSMTRELTLIVLERSHNREPHLVLNGYEPIHDDELARLRALLRSAFAELEQDPAPPGDT